MDRQTQREKARQALAEKRDIIPPEQSGEIRGERYAASAKDQIGGPSVPATIFEGSASPDHKGPTGTARRLSGNMWPDL